MRLRRTPRPEARSAPRAPAGPHPSSPPGAGGRGSSAAARRPVALVIGAVVLALAGCADAAGPGSAPSDGGTGTMDDDAAVPVLQIRRSGGFMPMGWDFATVPELTVLADGRAVTHGPQIEIWPPPVLPNLLVVDLDDDEVDALVGTARGAGLLDEPAPDYGVPPVADAPTTVVTLHVDGHTLVHSAEALGFADGTELGTEPGLEPGSGAGTDADGDLGPDVAAPAEDPAPGVLPEQRDARVRLAGFIARAHELVGAAGDGVPYVIEAFAVMARPAPAATGEDPELAPQVLPWPLATDLAAAHECVLVSGDDAVVLREALVGAGFTVQMEQAGVRYETWFRPLLPHEEGCADV